MMRGRAALLAVLLGACGPSSQPQADSGTPDAGLQPGFEEDPRPDGAAVYVTVDLADTAAPVVTLWATRLGPVFGLALRLKLDATLLQVQPPRVESWLGADQPKEARYLAAVRPGVVSLGAARRGPAVGEQEVTGPVKLASIPLKTLAPGRSRLEIEDLQVRRSDGKFVAVEAGGGELTVGGAP